MCNPSKCPLHDETTQSVIQLAQDQYDLKNQIQALSEQIGTVKIVMEQQYKNLIARMEQAEVVRYINGDKREHTMKRNDFIQMAYDAMTEFRTRKVIWERIIALGGLLAGVLVVILGKIL